MATQQEIIQKYLIILLILLLHYSTIIYYSTKYYCYTNSYKILDYKVILISNYIAC